MMLTNIDVRIPIYTCTACRKNCCQHPAYLGYFPHSMATGMKLWLAKPHQPVMWFSLRLLSELALLQYHCPQLSVKAIASTMCDSVESFSADLKVRIDIRSLLQRAS